MLPHLLSGPGPPQAMPILDRYIAKRILLPFTYCVLGFVSVWLVFDLSDNGQDFLDAQASLPAVAEYYLFQLPQVIVMSMPVALLLAVLYTLTQMSRRNEVISILCSGWSVVRLLRSMFVIGLAMSLLSTLLNYRLAPHAEANRRSIMENIKRGPSEDARSLKGHLYVDRDNHRTWYLARIYPSRERLRNLLIMEKDPTGRLLRNYYAENASYDHETQTWRLDKGKVVEFSPEGDMTAQRFFEVLRLRDWSETPWRIASSVLQADVLSVPELREYLTNNSDFKPSRLAPYRTQLAYRWALPWGCLVAVLIAGPLGIIYSRRGLMGSISLAIALFFLLIFSSSLFLAFGKGDRLAPAVAAWAPLVLFGGIGAFLIWMRSTNREWSDLLG